MKHPLHDIAWALINEGSIPISNCALRCSTGSENQRCTCKGSMDCPLGHPDEKIDQKIQKTREQAWVEGVGNDLYK